MTTETVLHRFWSRVFNSPDQPCILVRNPDKEPQIFVLASPMGMGHVAHVPPPPIIAVSYHGVGAAVSAVAAFLSQRGVQKGDRIALLGSNSPEWLIADLAIQSLGAVTVTIFPQLGKEQVNFIIADSGARMLLSDESQQLGKLAAEHNIPAVNINDIPAAIGAYGLKDQPLSLHFLRDELEKPKSLATWSAVLSQMAKFRSLLRPDGFSNITADDTASFIYTSGSTGRQKGAMLSHGNFAFACKAMLEHGFDLSPEREDVYLSYLSAAHVYERVAGVSLCLWAGVPLALCKTEQVVEYAKLVQPTALHGVPQVWERVRRAALDKIAKTPGLKGKIGRWALQQKSGFKHWLADALVFRKIRAELGGRVRIATCGGAAYSNEMIEFFDLIGVQILPGYGQTESTGPASVNRPYGHAKCAGGNCKKLGSSGTFLPGVEWKLVQDPAAGPDAPKELWLRGGLVFKGYWNLPEETRKTITADGWLRTGDAVEVDSEGFLFIKERINRMGKTSGGKFIAPDKIEAALKPHPIIQYVVPVFNGRPFVSALFFLNQQVAAELAGRAPGADAAGFYAQHPKVLAAVKAAVDEANTRLEKWEQLRKFIVVPEEATIEGGALTPTLKLRNEIVIKKYQQQVEGMYQRPGETA